MPITAAWRQQRQSVYRYLRRRLPDKAHAEDLTQETFLRFLQSPPPVSDPAPVRAWLLRVAHNLVVDHYRAQRTQIPLDQVDPAAETGSRQFRELESCIAPLAGRLPESYRTALLWDLEGLPQQEIARRQNLSLSGAKSRVQRARSLLKVEFERCCHYHFDAEGSLTGYGPRERTDACG